MMYSTQLNMGGDVQVGLVMRRELEDLLRSLRVNLFFVGHQHSYERTCPLYNGQCVEEGTVHIVAGTAGATVNSAGFSPSLGNWTVKSLMDYGYVRVDAGYEAMNVEFVRTNKWDGGEAGTVWDSFQIKPWV
jgi:hypothetical protein